MWEKLKGYAKSVWEAVPRKALYAAAGLVVAAVSKAHPDWPMPSPEWVVAFFLALISGHTLTDMAALIFGKKQLPPPEK